MKCKDRINKEFKNTMEDLKTLYKAENQETEELGSLNNYALSVGWVKAGTFEGQRADYWQYQMSYGGPSDEFRIYKNGDVEYWFLDWFDGASITLNSDDAEFIKEVTGFNEFGGIEE